jgi:putative peptide zinc metalloprotease protein
VSNTDSPNWYRVARLKPKLHSHIEIHRHDYRGLIWYVMEDLGTGRSHRFNPAAYQFIGLLDGRLTVLEVYDLLANQLGDFAPGQEEVIQILGQLHAADLIQTNVLVNTEELFERQARIKQAKFNHRLMNPVSQQLPLWDPEDFLNRHIHRVKYLFSPWVAVIWLLVVGYSALQAFTNWPTIARHFDTNALQPYNLIILFFLYPSIKILHELGHAFATKHKGGEVHEMGINFLLFMPIPYVNVSSASHFRNKFDRMLVSSAGILVETLLAALGLLLFLSAEPGIVQDIGFNIFLTGGVSSLFFNGNPLLKYDGYYFLADALGIPNLYQRSGQYWQYFLQRYLIGLKHAVSPATAPGEILWFMVYGIASLFYRLAMLWFICIYLTEKFFFLGILLALWLVTIQILLPLYKALRFVLTGKNFGRKKNRAVTSALVLLVLILGILGFLPIPSYSLAEGVIWLPEKAQVKAERDGFVDSLQVQSDQFVNEGDMIAIIRDDALVSQTRIARAKVKELQSQYRGEQGKNLVKAEILKQALYVAQAELQSLNLKNSAMIIKAAKSGRVLIPEMDDLPGRYVRHGELLGYILDGSPPSIRMVVPQDNIGQLREKIEDIKIRLVNAPEKQYDAAIIRQSPEATNKLPSPALATTGGGKIRVALNKGSEDLLTLQRVFLVDLSFVPDDKNIPLGTRAFVRIHHGGEALSKQWYRRIRQIFLRQFNA